MPAQPQSAGPTPRKRFRTTADLSDEQIQHKRIVDRRNQQAFRQRARDSFRSLKEEHAQLEEKCEGLESELATARDRIEVLTGCIRSMQGLASTVLGESSMANSEMGPVHMPPQPTLTHGDHSTPSATGQTLHATAPSASTSPHHIAEGQSPRSLPYTNPGEGRVSHDNSHSNACQSSDMALTEHQAPQENSLEDRPLETHLTPGGPSTHVQYAFSSPSSIITNLTTVPWQQATGSGAAYLTVPSFLEPTCPLDQILLDFLRKSHRMILQGATTDAAVGPNWLSVRSLLHRDQATPANPLNTIMSHVLNTFTHVGVVEKLAFFYLMSHTMRWMVYPTKESYSAMPPWLRPTVTQITTPHAAWIDNIPWPGVRDILIERADEFPFEVFSDYYSQSVSVNWKFDVLDAVSNHGEDTTIHSIFEKHICSLSNWTVSKEFLVRFPSMASEVSASVR